MVKTAGENSPPAPSQVPASSVWVYRGFVVVGVSFCILAFVLGWLAQTPLESLREYGRFVRNAQDVTQERYTRFQYICWFSSLSLASLGIGILLWRKALVEFLRLAWHPDTESTPRLEPAPEPRHVRIWLAVILGIGAALRLSLATIPMAYDESYSWLNFASRPLLQALGDLNSTNNHLFNTLCMFVTGRVFGPLEWALRIGTMTFGLAVLPACFIWARRWRGTGTALLTTALVAISAPLVTYSADARGYSYVLCCAVLLDDAMAQLLSKRSGRERSWILAGTAIVVGVWSMIIMGYAIIATLLWYVFNEDNDATSRERHPSATHTVMTSSGWTTSFWTRCRHLLVLGWVTIMLASLIYMPGYMIRGTLFLHDPVMRQSTSESTSFVQETLQGLTSAGAMLIEGAVPAAIMGGSVLLGLWFWPRDRHSMIRLLSPFVVVAVLNFVRHVNPPPRIYLWLLPWICLLAAHGLFRVVQLARLTQRTVVTGVIVGILGLGVWFGTTYWPVLLRSENRIGYYSVPDVVRRLQVEVASAPTTEHRLIVPLPCDLPSIFYMERSGFRVPINGHPQPGELLWLVTQETESPADVLNDGLVQLNDWHDRFTPWQVVERFETLTLHSAQLLPVEGESPPRPTSN